MQCRKALPSQGVDMLYRFMKFVSTSAYLLLIWLTWQWFEGDLGWGFSTSCLAISGLWLMLTWVELGSLFRTYFDILSRLKVLLPCWLGITLSGLAAYFGDALGFKAVAAVALFAWLGIYLKYRSNRKQYMTKGHGPLPKGTWVNPPADALKPGDLILTSGRIATRLHESVGHGEVVVDEPGAPELMAFSSYMEQGAVINPVRRITDKPEDRGHFVIMRLTRPLTAEQLELLPRIASVMLKQNDRWRQEKRQARDRMLARLPLPKAVKDWLGKKLKVTGYDWLGLFIGRRASDHWTCIGACLEAYERIGVKTNQYGTGLLGLGTGLFDPIKPSRFLTDKAFRILTDVDRAEHERHKALP